MSQNLYELIALGARYLFAALMVLIVARAWRITIIDSRRAKTLRRISPETGLSGELIVMEGDEKARRGMRYPVIREGMIGSSRRADIRVRHSSVRRRHALFQLTPEGLRVQAQGGAPMRSGKGHQAARELLLKDGDCIDIGRVRLMLVLSESTAEPERGAVPRRKAKRPDDWDGWDDEDDGVEANPWDDGAPGAWDDEWQDAPDRLFEENPILNRMPENRSDAPDIPDDLFFDD